MGYTYRRRRSGPNWGLIVSLALVVGAAAYFVPQYLNPQAGPPPPPLGGDAASAVAAAPSAGQTPAAVRLTEADQQFTAGHWTAAAAAYADVVRTDSANATAQAGWARALIYDDKPADAIEHAQKAADLEPRSAIDQAILALAFDWAGNTDRALTSARRAVELDPNLADGHAYLAEALIDKFRLKEASDELDHALGVGGADNPEVLRVQAYLAETNADYAGAVDLYRRAVDKAPERSYLELSLGHALRAMKRYEEAIQAFQRAADLNVDDPRAEGGMGMAYYAREEYDSAQSHLERSVEIDPNYANGWGQLGWVFYVQKQYDKAQPDFEKAAELEKDPSKNAEYRHALGWIYINTKQYAKAKEEFDQALAENPDLQGARDGLQVVAANTAH
ncbi:MAG: tetratricopeptide repeat protein [Chloroflexi bacterium]|nr:tetratricopeptide repeat protein [Chloroflexota bacterium]